MRAGISNRKLAETGAIPMLDAAHDRAAQILSKSGILVSEGVAAELDRYARTEAITLDHGALEAHSRSAARPRATETQQ